jgi:metal iron transporter
LLLYDRPKHKLVCRWLVLYPLYALSEIAIISTDLAELLGSAIALCMLFPKLPLWAGVLITSADVFVILAFKDPLGGRPVKMFELLIAALVSR